MSKRGFYTEKELNRKRIWLRIKIFAFVLFIAFIGWSVLRFANSEYLRISDFKVNDLVYGNEDKIKATVTDYLSGKTSFINNNSVWKFSKSSLTDLLINSDLSIKEVSVNVNNDDGKKVLDINIKERTPVAIWCGDGNEDCYYLDDAGLIFSKSADFEGEAFLSFHGGEYGIGKTIDAKYRISLLSELKTELKKIRIITEGVDFDGDTENIIVYHEKNPTDKFYLKVDTKTDLEKLPVRLSLVIKEYWIGTVLAPKNVEYVDMRFANNVVTKIEKK